MLWPTTRLAYWCATSAERAVFRMPKRLDAMSHLPIDQDSVAPDVRHRLRGRVVAERCDGAAEQRAEVLIAGTERGLQHPAIEGDLPRDDARGLDEAVPGGAEFVRAPRAQRRLEVAEGDVFGAGERADQRPASASGLGHRAQDAVRGEDAAVDAIQVPHRHALALVVEHLLQLAQAPLLGTEQIGRASCRQK